MKRLIDILASAKLFFWSLSWLMVLVVLGTVSQKSLGLYLAQKTFFTSWYFHWGILPLPGGLIVLSLISLGLLVKLVFRTRWKGRHLGIAFTHLGSFLLFFGAGVTALWSEETSLVIPEGEVGREIHDYYDVELAVIDVNGEKKDREFLWPEGALKAGSELSDSELPFALKVLKFARNSRLEKRESAGEGRRGMATQFDLFEKKRHPKEEENRAGILFQVGSETHLVVENPSFDLAIWRGDKKYIVQLRHRKKFLPFALELIDFERKLHPGTDMASSYKSVVKLYDGDILQDAVISMNRPLRYKGYTFYQSSFSLDGESETTVLAVVKNIGRSFPYFSSLLMCFGILLHLFLTLSRRPAS